MSWWNPFRTKGRAENGDVPFGEGVQSNALIRDDKNPRRYPRVYLIQPDDRSEKLLSPALRGAQAVFDDQKSAAIYDLSHSGAAFLREAVPQLENLAVGSRVVFGIAFDDHNSETAFPGVQSSSGRYTIHAKVARVSDRVVAVDFEALAPDVRLALSRFLQAKTIGLAVRKVDPKVFQSLSDGFTHWFQGPNETNAFLRYDELTLKAAQVTMGSDVLEWRALEGGRIEYHTVRIIEDDQTDTPAIPLNDISFVKRVLEMLSQIRDEKSSIDPLIHVLMEVVPK